MLRSLSTHNFVHFTKPQRLVFKPGANFIIGANSTGKTALFELIRRCLSQDISTTTTSVPDKTKLAYAVCGFELSSDNKYLGSVDETILENVPSKVVSGLFVKSYYTRSRASDQDLVYFYKVFCSNIEDNTWQIGLQKYKGSWDCNSNDLELILSTTKVYQGHVAAIMNKLFVETAMDVDKHIEELFFTIEKDKGDALDAKRIEQTFLWLTNSFVSVFPMRSAGPLQWSRSKFVDPSQRHSNYRNTSKRSEILMDLLSKEKRDLIDWTTEQNYHSHLVHPYIFKKEKVENEKQDSERVGQGKGQYEKDGKKDEEFEIRVYNSDESSDKSIPLLKTPDGIVEAMQLSLLLSEKATLTIQLEEPDRGMHPQMINKMRDWVLKKIKNKTVLIISHHPAILDHTTLDRVHACSKTFDNGHLSHVVTKFPNPIQYRKYGIVEEMKSLLFSARVLFVEGFTDKIILDAVFDILVNHPEKYETIRGSLSDIQFVKHNQFQKYISSLQIVELREGWPSGKTKMDFCQKINKESLVMYDFDVVRKLSATNDVDKGSKKKMTSEQKVGQTSSENFVKGATGKMRQLETEINLKSERDNEIPSNTDSDQPSAEKIKLTAKFAGSIDNVVISAEYDDGFKTKKQKITSGTSKGWKELIMKKTEQFCGEIAGIFKQQSVIDSFKDVGIPIQITGKDIGVQYDKKYENVESFRTDSNEIRQFESACEKRNVFVWVEGSIEDVINKAGGSAQFRTKHQMPTGSFRGWKKHLIDKDEAFCVELAIMLINTSDEIHRFFRFLHKKMNQADIKDGKQNPNKRNLMDNTTPYQRKISRDDTIEKEEEINITSTSDIEMVSQDTNLSEKDKVQLHTGVSQDLSLMDL